MNKVAIPADAYPALIRAVVMPGKDPARVPTYLIKHPDDWIAQYKMLLPDGEQCSGCQHIGRCERMFDQKPLQTYCQFYPSRYSPKAKPTDHE